MNRKMGRSELMQLITAWLTGFFSGFLVSIPIGPINVTIINEGVQRGFLRAWVVGLGAMSMDMVYCGIGLAGSSSLFDTRLLRATMELVSFLLVLYLGLKYLRAVSLQATSKSAERIEHRLQPHTAYMTGLVRVLGNPGALLLWITLSTIFISHEWVAPNWASRSLCILGVGLGVSSWVTLLSYGASRGHRRISTSTLLRLSRISGACLLTISLVIAVRLVRLLAHH